MTPKEIAQKILDMSDGRMWENVHISPGLESIIAPTSPGHANGVGTINRDIDADWIVFTKNTTPLLAQAFLALSEKCEKLEAVAEAARNLHEECHRISVETDAPNTQAMVCLWRVIEELEKE